MHSFGMFMTLTFWYSEGVTKWTPRFRGPSGPSFNGATGQREHIIGGEGVGCRIHLTRPFTDEDL